MKVEQIAFSELAGFSDLFRDYVNYDPKLKTLYNGDFRSDKVLLDRAKKLQSVNFPRTSLAGELKVQNSRWACKDDTLSNIEKLGSGEAISVVTGQQIGLFLNPLYIIYKAITAIQLARYVSDDLGVESVPVFWLASADHDFEEIKTAYFPKGRQLESLSIEKSGNYSGAVGRIELDDSVSTVIDQLKKLLPEREGKESILKMVQQSYKKGNTLEDAFALLLTQIFEGTGLIIISPDSPVFKNLSIDLFEKELREADAPEKILSESSAALQASYHAQLDSAAHNLFYLGAEKRSKIEFRGGSWNVDGQQMELEEVIELLKSSPEKFSPNVALRPLMQDVLFPTLAYVAGPGETAYYAQLKEMYTWGGLAMPIIYPRASITLLESRISKQLKKFGWDLADLPTNDPESRFGTLAKESIGLDLDQVFNSLQSEVDKAFASIDSDLEKIDKTMMKSSISRQVAIKKEVGSLKKKVLRQQKKKMSELGDQIHSVYANLNPGTSMQERKISALYFLAHYGPRLIGDLLDNVLLDTSQHQVIHI